MTKVDLRKATGSDAPALAMLCHEVQDWHAATYPQEFRARIDMGALTAHFIDFLNEPDHFGWIAQADGAAAGYLTATLEIRSSSLFRPNQRVLMIDNIGVTRTHQRQGHAHRLMQAARVEAKKTGCSGLKLTTYAANTTGQAFFASEGFSTQVLMQTAPL